MVTLEQLANVLMANSDPGTLANVLMANCGDPGTVGKCPDDKQ